MVVYSRNDPLLCIIFFSSLKGVASDWFYSLLPRSFYNFEELTKAFLTQYASCQRRPRRTAIISSPSRWGRKKASNHTSTSFKANSSKSPTVVRASLYSHSSTGCRFLTPCTSTSSSTISLGWVMSFHGLSHTFIWKKQWRLLSCLSLLNKLFSVMGWQLPYELLFCRGNYACMFEAKWARTCLQGT